MATGEPADGSMIEAAAMHKVLEVARQLAKPFELGDLFKQVIDAGREILDADRGTIFLYDAPRRELYSSVATGAADIRFSIDKGIAGETARTRKTINVPDCYADARFNREVDVRTGYRTKCLVAVPLIGLDDELVGVMQLINPAHGCIDAMDEKIAEALASQAAVAIQRVRLNDERMVKMKLERDLALARQIQMNVLPKSLPDCPGYDLAGFNRPAEETGGDIWDLIPVIDEQSHTLKVEGSGEETEVGRMTSMLILLADATGHGIGPAISVTQVRAMLRMGMRCSAGLDDLVLHINQQVADDLASGRFVTAFVGRLDPLTHRIDYHAPGQGPLLHFHAADERCQWHPASTLPLGIMPDIDFSPPPPILMAPGDSFILLTDGFYEYQNREGQQMNQDRIAEIVKRHHKGPAQQLVEAFVRGVSEFAGGAPQLDDLTAVVIKRL